MRRALPLLLLLPTLAWAQSDEVDPESGRVIRYQRQTELDFDSVAIDAALVGPELHYSPERPRAEFNPLIRIRRDFNAELSASTDEVK